MQKLKKMALDKQSEKFAEYSAYTQTIHLTMKESDAGALASLKTYKRTKKQHEDDSNAPDAESVEMFQIKLLSEFMDELLTQELNIVSQFEETIKDFSAAYTELSTLVCEFSSGFFSNMREGEMEFHEKFMELVIACADKISKFGNEDLDDSIRDVPRLTTHMSILTNS